MNIKERAYQIASVNMKNKCSPAELEDFAEALVAELAKENKPVAHFQELKKHCERRICFAHAEGAKPLYTLPPTAEQIEQETAEAIAKLVEPSKDHIENPNDYIGGQEGIDILLNVAEAIRSGKWNEYK